MPTWPKDKLLKHGPDLPMEERIRRCQHNIRTIRASGCAVPISAYADRVDPAEIELSFADSAYRMHRLVEAIKELSKLPSDSDIR